MGTANVEKDGVIVLVTTEVKVGVCINSMLCLVAQDTSIKLIKSEARIKDLCIFPTLIYSFTYFEAKPANGLRYPRLGGCG